MRNGPKVSVRAPNGLIVPLRVPSGLRASARVRNGLMLPVLPPPSGPMLPVLPPHSGRMLRAQVLSGPWTGVRLPASSNVQPARVSVCASAQAVRS